MKFRKATFNEIDKLIYLRKKQLVEEGIEPNQEIDTELKEFFTNKMSDGSLIEWVVEDNDEIIATGAIILPTPTRVAKRLILPICTRKKVTVDRELPLSC